MTAVYQKHRTSPKHSTRALTPTQVVRGARSPILDRVIAPLNASVQESRVFRSESKLDRTATHIRDLIRTDQNWASGETDRPSPSSIHRSLELLKLLQSVDLIPELVLPSAEGGVALDLAGPEGRRALIETLNTGVSYILLYDHISYCKTLILTRDEQQESQMFSALSTYIRRGPDAGEQH